MMDAAYFVGRKELLEFLNDALDLRLQKIEQTASGAVACQLFDIMYPNAIAMSKVNWGAKSDYEFVQNYKLLQTGFNKHCVQRYVDVDKLIRAKYQDNLEFMQWFKAFFENGGGPAHLPEYRPRDVRLRGKGGDKYNAQFGGSGGGGGTRAGSGAGPTRGRTIPASAAPHTSATSAAASVKVAARPGGTTTAVGTAAAAISSSLAPTSPRHHRPLRERLDQPTTTTTTAKAAASTTLTKGTSTARGTTRNDNDEVDHKDAAASAEKIRQLQQQNKTLLAQSGELEVQVQDLQAKVDDLEGAVLDIEKERDFYFEKLRNVEVLLQVHQEKAANPESSVVSDSEQPPSTGAFPPDLVDKIFQVLYATPDDEVIVNNDGELIPADQLLSQELSAESAA